MPNLEISQFINLAGAQTPTSIVPLVVNNSAPNYFSTLNDLFSDLSLNTATGAIQISNASLTVDGDNGLRVIGNAAAPADSIIDGIDARLVILNGTAPGSNGIYTAINGAALCAASSNLPDWAVGVSGTAQYNAVAGATLGKAIGVYGYTNGNGPVVITNAYSFYSGNAGITVGAAITNQYGFYSESITGATNNYAIYTNAGIVRLGDHVTIGGQASASELRLLEPSGSGTNYTGFKAPALAADVVYTLPNADGTSGQVLQTNGSKVLSWATVSGSTRWDQIANPSGNLSLIMGTYLTTLNWATGTGSNNLFNLTSDNSSNGTGVLLNIATGISSAIKPISIAAAGTVIFDINAVGAAGLVPASGQALYLGNGVRNTDLIMQSLSIGNAFTVQGSSAMVGIGAIAVGGGGAQLHVKSQSASRVAARFDSASSPSVNIVTVTNNGTTVWSINSLGDENFAEGINQIFGTTTGTKIGTSTSQKIGFWNATPVVQQVLATGAGATVDNVISFLQTIGLCKQS